MKKFTKIACIVALCIALPSCVLSTDESRAFDDETQYEVGVMDGKADMFERLYNAAYGKNSVALSSGDVWETSKFTLKLSDTRADGEKKLSFDLTLSDRTIEECYNYNLLFFNIYTLGNPQSEEVLYDDIYALYADCIDGNNIHGTVSFSEDFVLYVIIVYDGVIYTADYFVS